MKAKSPESLQEQDDNTGEQSDQDELSDEVTAGEEDDDASVAEFNDGSDADDSDDSSGDGSEGGDTAE